MLTLSIIPVFISLWTFAHATKSINVFNIMIITVEENFDEESMVNKAIDLLQNNYYRIGFQFGCIITVNNKNISDGQSFIDHICKMYEESVEDSCGPHLIIDLTTGEPFSEAAKIFSLALGIPTVAATSSRNINPWNLTNHNHLQYLIQIAPPADIVPEIIPIICQTQKMTNAAIFYDDMFKIERFAPYLMEGMAIRQIFVKITDLENIQGTLRSLHDVDIFNYFILGSIRTIKHVLMNIDHDNFFSKKFAWHAITLQEGTIQLEGKGITILFVRPVPTRPLFTLQNSFLPQAHAEITHYFYEDFTSRTIMSLNNFARAMFLTNNNLQNSSSCSKINFSPKNNTNNFRKHFFKYYDHYTYGPITFTTDNVGFMKFSMVLEEVNLNDSSSNVIGYWSTSDKYLNILKKEKMKKLVSIPIYKVALVLQPPFVLETTDVKGNKNFSGFCIDLIYEISKILGFEYELYLTPDDKMGSMDEKGEWDGMIKEVMEKRADIGLSSLSVTAEREMVVEFTKPFYDLVGMTILMKKSEEETNFFKFFTVMEGDVWVCLITTYFFTSLFIWFFNRLNPSTSFESNINLRHWNQEISREFTFKECFWFCMTSLTPQGGGEAPNNLPGRIVAATWWLFGWIIVTSYTANLAAFLTVSRLDKPINSLDDLAQQYRVKYAPLRGSSGMTYFQRMADIESRFLKHWKNISVSDKFTEIEKRDMAVWHYPLSDKYTKMWKAMQDAGMPITLQEALDRVLASRSSSDGFAYIGDGTNIKYHTMLHCDLLSVGEEFSKLPLAMAVQKSSPIKEAINKAITRLLHRRRFEQLKEKWWEENPSLKTCINNDELAEGISIKNIAGVFSVIVMGTVMATFVLICEYVCLKSKKSNFYGSKIHGNEGWIRRKLN